MFMSRRITAAAVLAVLAACTVHEPRPAFRRGVFIDDRGISVPLPPPSLADAPKQDVDVEGQLPGEDPLEPGTILHIEDLDGTSATQTEVDVAHEGFIVEAFYIDLTANCLELWLETPDGRESERVQVHAVIVGEQEIRTEAGCE
jgi:hypothetical protein